jgi:hypothetical protein
MCEGTGGGGFRNFLFFFFFVKISLYYMRNFFFFFYKFTSKLSLLNNFSYFKFNEPKFKKKSLFIYFVLESICLLILLFIYF